MPLIHFLRWQNVVDFLVLSVAFYVVLLWAKQTRALHFALMIVGFHAAALLAGHFDLTISSWVMDGASLAVIGLVILLFQAELQHSILRWDTLVRLKFRVPADSSQTYDAVAAAMFAMAHSNIGAVVVLARKDPIVNLVSGGIGIDGEVSKGLLEAIFRRDSPIHDGAVIISGDRIALARVVLPSTGRDDLPAELGTRHRAALGLAESSDALVLVSSEERGQVVVIEDSQVRPMPDESTLRKALYSLQPKRPRSLTDKLRSLLFANMKYRLSAVALASLIWGISFFGGGAMVKSVSASVEFVNVPSGLYISNQSASSVSVQLRGNSWLMDSAMASLTARLDVSKLDAGWHTISLDSNDLKLPPGVDLERVLPKTVSVRLVREVRPQR